MDIIQLQSEYIDVTRIHGQATESGDWEGANAAHDRIVALLRTMRQMPDRGSAVLFGALQVSDANVRCWAARHLLPIAEEQALQALAKLAEGQTLSALNAKMVVQEWHAGHLHEEPAD